MNGNENKYLGEEPVSSLILMALFLIIQTYRKLRTEKTGRTLLSADRANDYA